MKSKLKRDDGDDPLLLQCMAFPVDIFQACLMRQEEPEAHTPFKHVIKIEFELKPDVDVQE